MNETLSDWIGNDPERERLFAQEKLIVAVAEHIWEQMDKRKFSKSEIATALGKSKAFVTQLLNGTRNMTLRSLADIAFVLDANVDVQFRPKRPVSDWSMSTVNKVFTSVVAESRIEHDAGRSCEPQQPEIVRIKLPEVA